ncbi:SDR family NAD(P)-dependent oxidoreductase [Streptomyces sp. NPDC002886]|uniref:SDR family NAD(P)-dependent oxidoreductase n=1 Tax=Streptomyces sp. NPDC002886 TaxID=3364667 RepID=UPI0036A4B9C2
MAVTAKPGRRACFLPDLLDTRGYYLQIASLASMGASPLMNADCASKARVEAFAHALHAELAHRDVTVGIAYINWTDTEMIWGTDAQNVITEVRSQCPRRPARCIRRPLVAERLATAAVRREASVYVPAWLRVVQPVRALFPVVVTRVARTELARLEGHPATDSHRFARSRGEADERLRDG